MKDCSYTSLRASVSYTLVAACAPRESQAAAAGGTNNEWFPGAMATYMNGTAESLQRRSSDIVWVTLLPYHLPSVGQCLSTNGIKAGFETALSIVLAHTASTVESLILEAEHAFLEKACGHGGEGPGHELLQTLRNEAGGPGAPLDTCSAPDEALAAQLQVQRSL